MGLYVRVAGVRFATLRIGWGTAEGTLLGVGVVDRSQRRADSRHRRRDRRTEVADRRSGGRHHLDRPARLRIMLAADGRRPYKTRPKPCLTPKTRFDALAFAPGNTARISFTICGVMLRGFLRLGRSRRAGLLPIVSGWVTALMRWLSRPGTAGSARTSSTIRGATLSGSR
jgi:hypothetical protein